MTILELMETCVYIVYIYISRFDHATSMVYVHDETAYPVDLGAPELRKLCGGALWDEARVVDEQWEHHVKHLQKIKVPQSTVGICWYMLVWYIR